MSFNSVKASDWDTSVICECVLILQAPSRGDCRHEFTSVCLPEQSVLAIVPRRAELENTLS